MPVLWTGPVCWCLRGDEGDLEAYHLGPEGPHGGRVAALVGAGRLAPVAGGGAAAPEAGGGAPDAEQALRVLGWLAGAPVPRTG